MAILKEHLFRISKIYVKKVHLLGACERYWRLDYIQEFLNFRMTVFKWLTVQIKTD